MPGELQENAARYEVAESGRSTDLAGYLLGPRALRQFSEPCTCLSKWLARTVGATSNIGALNCSKQQPRE